MNKNKRAKRSKLKKKLANIKRMETPPEGKKDSQKMRTRRNTDRGIMEAIHNYIKETGI